MIYLLNKKSQYTILQNRTHHKITFKLYRFKITFLKQEQKEKPQLSCDN